MTIKTNKKKLENNLHEELLKKGFKVVDNAYQERLFILMQKLNQNGNSHFKEYAMLPLSQVPINSVKKYFPNITEQEIERNYFLYSKELS